MGASRVEIDFDDGLWRYRLGPGAQGDAGAVDERGVRSELRRWLTRDPWRGQLRRYAAAEIRVEARTDEGLINRLCALLATRGLWLRRLDRMGLLNVGILAEDEAEPLVSERDEDDSHWIHIVVTDQSDRPLDRVRYRIKLTDGRVRQGRTDAEGAIHMDGMPAGECELSLPEYDESAWNASGPATSARARSGSSGRAHTVHQGECIATIAAEHGFAWQTIWNDGANEGLRSKRENPHILAPGDIVQIPPKTLRVSSLQTDRTHKLEILGQFVKLRLRLTGSLAPLPNEEYLLEVGPQKISDTTSDDGLVEATIRVSDRTATLTLPARMQRYTLELGHLDPIDTISGTQGRLRNIGTYDTIIDGQEGRPLSSALRILQAEEGLAVTGKRDSATLDKLRELHGS